MGRLSLGASVALAVLAAATASAHHAFSAEFDAKMPVTLQGTVTRIEMVNPHGWIFIDVKGPDGKIVNWAIETGGCTPQEFTPHVQGRSDGVNRRVSDGQ